MKTSFPPRSNRALPGLVLLFILGMLAPATAQYAISLEIPRRTFVAMEPIVATVTINNRSGADVYLDAPGQKRWLSFSISNTDGRTFPPLDIDGEQPFILKAGTTVSKKIRLTDSFALSEIGTYGMTASVIHPASTQYYESNRVQFTIVDATVMWEEPVGVPEGFKRAGRIHNMAVLIHRDSDSTSLYARIVDERSRLPVATFQLGPVSLVLDPQITIDSKNNLHVFFLAAPKIFCHALISPDGELKKRVYYRELDGDRPAMITAANGDISVRGGFYFDPSVVSDPSIPGLGEGTTPTRSVSDRPPGL